MSPRPHRERKECAKQGQPPCALAEFAPAVDQFDMVGFPLHRSATEASPHFRDWRVNYARFQNRHAACSR